MNGLKIYGENFVNEYCDIIPVSGSGTKNYLFDQRQATKWLSEGSSDIIEESLDTTFKNWQGEAVERAFDRLVILNHNLKAITADYYNGAAWVSIPEATLTLSSAYTIIEIPTPISAGRVRLNCSTTQIANEEKNIGEFKICLSVMEEPAWISDFPRRDVMLGGDYRLAGGPLVAWKEWTKVSGVLSLKNVALTSLDALLPYMKRAEYLTMVFWQDFDPAEVYEFQIVNAPQIQIDRKKQLFSISLSLEER